RIRGQGFFESEPVQIQAMDPTPFTIDIAIKSPTKKIINSSAVLLESVNRSWKKPKWVTVSQVKQKFGMLPYCYLFHPRHDIGFLALNCNINLCKWFAGGFKAVPVYCNFFCLIINFDLMVTEKGIANNAIYRNT